MREFWTGVLALGLIAAALFAGSAAARGGNHDCDDTTGTFYSSHFNPSGDNIVAGYYTSTGPFPGEPQESLVAKNTPTDGGTPSSLGCGGDPGTWTLFLSELGPGDDSVRLDAKDLEVAGQDPQALPKPMDSLLTGGGGSDVLRGHSGHDEMKGGPGGDVLRPLGGRDLAAGGAGADVIRAADGARDTVSCGKGPDKAVVDKRDDVSGCEDLIER